MSTVLDAKVLRHRDLHAVDVVAVPDWLQHPVREAQEDGLLEAHLPQEVIDPVQLRLIHVLVKVLGQLVCGRAIVAEGLLDHNPSGFGQPGFGEALDDRREQERRDLEIEDGCCGAGDRLTHALVGGRVAEVALHIGKPRRQTLEHLLVELLASGDDGLARALDELVDRPVVHRHTDDREREQLALLQPVQRTKRHHPR